MPLRVAASVSSLVVLGALLIGCTAPVTPVPVAPTASPVVEATPTPTPSPSQTPAAPVVDELVLRPTFVELHSAGQVIRELDYMSPSADAIARFTDLFGREPERKSYEGGNH